MNILREDVYIVIGRSTPICSYCVQAKQLLEQRGIDFEYIDVTTDSKYVDFIKNELKRTTVPQIRDDNGNWIGGFEQLCKLLKV